jgi:signal transduction histidine kinase
MVRLPHHRSDRKWHDHSFDRVGGALAGSAGKRDFAGTSAAADNADQRCPECVDCPAYEVRDHLRERAAAEDALRRAHDALESLVEQRTAALRRLSVKLLRVQDDERRRIARELHDSLGQDLTAAKISLDMLAQECKVDSTHLQDARALVDQSISDTRTLSHLLHPPLLDEAGFLSAAKWYVDGFGQRSGIATKLDLPSHVLRLPRRTEIALFRILQEALTNVHRHSGSRAVNVSVSIDNDAVVLKVQDFGTGVSGEVLDRFWKTGNVGVGLAGIRERLKELGGSLQIQSNHEGTVLTAQIPIAAADRKSDERSAAASAPEHPSAFSAG